MEEPPPTCPAQPPAPDPVDLTTFYGTPQPPLKISAAREKRFTPAPLIYRLGPLPFWRGGQERFADTLEQLYARAAARRAVWAREAADLHGVRTRKVIITGGNLQLRGRRIRIDTTALC